MAKTQNQIKNVSNINKEKLEAKKFWSNEESDYYYNKVPQTDVIITTIKNFNKNEHQEGLINSVFEFGCHSGRNLYYIKQELPRIEIFGTDINKKAIESGRKRFEIQLKVGSEEYLSKIPSNEYDMVFTVSVLDHLVEPDFVCSELTRITKKYIVLLEPFYGKEGKITQMAKNKWKFWLKKSFPFSYSWDYRRIFSNLNVQLIDDIPCPLEKDYSGPYYRLYKFSKNLN